MCAPAGHDSAPVVSMSLVPVKVSPCWRGGFCLALMLVWGQPLTQGSYINTTKLKLKFIGSLDTNPNTAAPHTVAHEARSLYDDDISYLCGHEMTRFEVGVQERVAWKDEPT